MMLRKIHFGKIDNRSLFIDHGGTTQRFEVE